MRSLAQLDRDFDQLVERVCLMQRMVERALEQGSVQVRQSGAFVWWGIEEVLFSYIACMVDVTGKPHGVVITEMLEMPDDDLMALLAKLPPDQREPVFGRVLKRLANLRNNL